jgi:hypothetical protein
VSLSVSHAASFLVTIDTTGLAGSGAAPFSLEVQFNDGGGTVTNTAILSNFDFGIGGGATGSPTYNCTSGSGAACAGTSRDLSSTVVLSDSSDAFNEFLQGFTPSSSDPLQFQLDVTTNVETPAPDGFTLSLFDSSGQGIPTSFFDVFVELGIDQSVVIMTFPSDPTQPPPGCPTCPPLHIPALIAQPTPTAIPEPTTLVLLGSGLAGLIGIQRWRKARPLLP